MARHERRSTGLADPPRPIVEEWSWQQNGHCQNLPSEVFFPEDTTTGRHRRANEERAKRICRDCPVIAQCREHAMRTPENYGIWGAMTARERAGSTDRQRRVPAVTSSGR